MPAPEETAAFRRVVWTLYFALLGSVGLYWVVVELVAPGMPPREPGMVKTAFQLIAGLTAAAVLYLRFSGIGPLLQGPAVEPAALLARLRLFYIVCFALSQAVALYGFVLRLLGGTREDAALFFVASGGLFLLCFPRIPYTPETH